MLLTVYSIIALFYWAFLTVWLIFNGRKIKHLASIQSLESGAVPSVVVVIAVRNEENALREALTSVCDLNYSNYKIVVVNDRSTDNTGKILSELEIKYSHLTVVNIRKLPPGWLGKNNALYTGAIASGEEYILFTDADVLFRKDVLNKAIHYCLQNRLDHLAILPGIISSSLRLRSVVLTFVIMLTSVQRPWAAKIKTSKASMGVGAFNLVKRQAYLRAGTHKAIAMRPDDDLKLAAIIKASGGIADVLYGQEALKVEWYASVKEFINGLMKNLFSGFKYNVFLAIAGALGTVLFFILPLPLILILGNDLQRVLIIFMFLFQVILYAEAPGVNGKWWYAFMSIYAGIIIFYVIIKSTIITLYHNGIYWRNTFYSLKELRRNK